MTPLRILIADDHALMRHGVRTVLERQAGWVVCGEAGTGREAVAKAVDLRPDIVVLDISMPELNGLEAARQIRRAVPAKIVMLTVHQADQILIEVMDAGAHGCVLKADAGRTLVEAIRALRNGGEFFTDSLRVPAARGAGPRRRATAGRATGSGDLTPREREVLQLLTEGKSNKQVGAVLGMTTKTAETHRAHILAKLDLHSTSELVRYAIRHRIIEP